MRKITAAGAALALAGTLALGAAPAQAAPKPKQTPQVPPDVIKRLPAHVQKAIGETFGTLGWDEKGPYIVWGDMSCHLHFLDPSEWSWAWGTGPCWF
ncbi:hypothetical protein [Actinomadura opuntiae]|uniref:hypothetical protein n=1 Tax=Actinomadura sp. OS1-43 TaxID=604315 RepID=UPI00255A864E|nr:hypothetical protein [Actinomadura sp. OS1-43]MDL4815336.1 hypothetical protein [Actinomadura sp. OS1-43]